MMSNGGSGKTESVIPFEPKLNLRAEAVDPLDAAGQTILDVLRQAAAAAEANNQQAREVAHKLSAQVLAAEDRIRELVASVSHHQDRADRAERWMYQISVEIEQSFFAEENSRRSQSPLPALAIVEQDGPHAVAFPCRRVVGAWIAAENNKWTEVRRTVWSSPVRTNLDIPSRLVLGELLFEYGRKSWNGLAKRRR
jgi:hypothetical protein